MRPRNTAKWRHINDRRMELIERDIASGLTGSDQSRFCDRYSTTAEPLTPEEAVELAKYQAIADERIHAILGPDIERLEKLRDELIAKGWWEGD